MSYDHLSDQGDVGCQQADMGEEFVEIIVTELENAPAKDINGKAFKC